MMLMLLLIVFSCLSVSLKAQTCQDSGQSNSCQCPFGLTNSPNCDTLACGNPYILSSNRTALNVTAGSDSGGNGCQSQCTDGFGGLTCNMCRTSQACQSLISTAPSGTNPSNPLAFSASQDAVCNTELLAYGVNFAQCEVQNPTLASLYPGRFWGTIQRNVNPSIAPMQTSVLSTLSAGTARAEIWFSPNATSIPQLQFYCQGMNCAQVVAKNSGVYRCESMKCHCLPGTMVCGAASGVSLSGAINAISGGLALECTPFNSTAPLEQVDLSRTCQLRTDALEKILGPNGLGLVNCASGECIQRSTAEALHQSNFRLATPKIRPSVGFLLGLIALLSALLALVALVLCGIWQQHKARHPLQPSSSGNAHGAARLVWEDLRYMLPSTGPGSGYQRARRASSSAAGRNPPRLSSSDKPPVAVLENQHAVHDIHDSKQILRGLSGTVEPGKMMAIMGPSGSGKSTFLDILAGQRKAGKVSGRHSISIPDQKMTTASADGITIGFVDQADVVSATSTVREALTFAAKLKLPEDISAQARESRVAEVIEMLGLSHVAQSRIGNDEVRGLSGGERRRVSIGLELISKPSILFLDEPTSGLDSVSATRVVNVLKGLSTNAPEGCGTTIVCSIHQPSSQIYYAFDSIFLLAPGGRQVYCGKTEDASAFIASHGLQCPPGYNIADYLLEVASDPPESLFESAELSDKCSEGYPVSIQSNPAPYFTRTQPRTTMMTQFQSLSQREWITLKRDPTLFCMHAAMAVVTGVFLGAMYFQVKLTIAGFQNRIGSMFFLGAIVSFSALSALNNFLHVRLLFMRERASKYYSPATWLLSRLCFDVIPLRVLPSLTISTIMYFMVGLQPHAENFLKFLLIVLQLTIVQTLFNFLLAAFFSEGGHAILLASLTNLLQFAFAGFFVNLSTLSPALKWLQYLAPFKYALEAMTLNEVSSGLMIVDNLQGINIQTSASLIMDTLFGFKANAFWRDVFCLFAFMVGFTAILVSTVYCKLQQTR